MTLTELSVATKKTAFWLIVIVISFYTLKFAFFKAKALYLTLNPPKLPPAEASFGSIPKLDFGVLNFAEGSFPEYVLDTKTGRLPSFPDRVAVYKLSMPVPRITAEKEAKEFAGSTDFWWSPTKKTLTEFVWSGGEGKRSLYFNIATKKIVLETNPGYLSENLSVGFVPSPAEAQNKAYDFLKSRGLFTDDLLNAETRTAYVIADKEGLHETINYLQANLVRVDFYRKVKIDNDNETLVYGKNPLNATVSVYVASPFEYEKRNSIELTYPIFYYNSPSILPEKSDYPVIPVEKAWDFVKNGAGALVYLKKNTDNFYASYAPLAIAKMEMRDVRLMYHQTEDPTPFLEPIYVFEGVFTTSERESGAFYIYVQAVDPKYVVQ